MSISDWLAITATACLVCGVIFQLLLAAGLPFGGAAWGGRHPGRLPRNLRLASLAAAVPLLLAAWVVLARADLIAPGSAPLAIRIAAWVFAVFMALNTVGNLASSGKTEKRVMAPLTLLLAACFLAVALS